MRRLCVLLAVLVAVQSLSNLKKPNQPSAEHGVREYVEIGNETFFIYTSYHVNWYEASFFCSDMSMRLLTLDTEERWLLIFNYLNNNMNYSPFEWFWFSGTKPAGSDQWIWAHTGANFTFSAWNANQPSLSADEAACTSFSHGSNGWDDDRCQYNTLAYICEQIPGAN